MPALCGIALTQAWYNRYEEQSILLDHMASIVVAALKQHAADAVTGALVLVDESHSRVLVLPI